MYFGSDLVRTMYTRPNFPFPRGRPMSKSCKVQFFVGACLERSEFDPITKKNGCSGLPRETRVEG